MDTQAARSPHVVDQQKSIRKKVRQSNLPTVAQAVTTDSPLLANRIRA
jgi:hypothetical protein